MIKIAGFKPPVTNFTTLCKSVNLFLWFLTHKLGDINTYSIWLLWELCINIQESNENWVYSAENWVSITFSKNRYKEYNLIHKNLRLIHDTLFFYPLSFLFFKLCNLVLRMIGDLRGDNFSWQIWFSQSQKVKEHIMRWLQQSHLGQSQVTFICTNILDLTLKLSFACQIYLCWKNPASVKSRSLIIGLGKLTYFLSSQVFNNNWHTEMVLNKYFLH